MISISIQGVYPFCSLFGETFAPIKNRYAINKATQRGDVDNLLKNVINLYDKIRL